MKTVRFTIILFSVTVNINGPDQIVIGQNVSLNCTVNIDVDVKFDWKVPNEQQLQVCVSLRYTCINSYYTFEFKHIYSIFNNCFQLEWTGCREPFRQKFGKSNC
jgi:hypothetical protein